MARGHIVADTGRLDSAAAQVRACADSYHSSYVQLFQAIEDMRSAWDGSDNMAFTNQIQGYRGDFQRMEQLMRDYADFLTRSAAAYRAAQGDIAAQARNLPRGG